MGWPKKELVEHEGLWFTLRGLTGLHDTEELLELASHEEPPYEVGDPRIGLE